MRGGHLECSRNLAIGSVRGEGEMPRPFLLVVGETGQTMVNGCSIALIGVLVAHRCQ